MTQSAAACAKCGAALPEGARFCPSCGATVGAAVPPPPPPRAVAPPPPTYYQVPAPAQKNSTLLVVLLIVGLVLVALVVIVGVVAWTTLGARTSSTVTTAVKALPSGTVNSGAPTPAPSGQPVIQVGDSTNPEAPPVATPVEAVSLAGVGEGEHVGPVTSGDQAAALVLGTPDAVAWAAQVAEARTQGKKRQALVTVERKPNGHYLVHVFESVEDEEPGHTATFGWFDVDNEMGAIKNDMVDSD